MPLCSAFLASGAPCSHPAIHDTLCGVHYRQLQHRLVLQREADARAPPVLIPEGQVRCSARLTNHTQCSQFATVNGKCTRHDRRERERIAEAPVKAAERRIQMLARHHEPLPLAEMRAVLTTLPPDIEPQRLQRLRDLVNWYVCRPLRRRLDVLWPTLVPAPGNSRYVQAMAHVETWRAEAGLDEDVRRELGNYMLNVLTLLYHHPAEVAHENETELGLLARDKQNVHTAPVNKQTSDGIAMLVAADPGPARQGFNTRIQICVDFECVLGKSRVQVSLVEPDIETWWKRSIAAEKTAAPLKYHSALRGLWATINQRPKDQRKELVKRLWEECYESVGMCAQGHLSRLCNVMIGFDDSFKVPETMGDALQRRMAEISAMDLSSEEQIKLAKVVLEELNVPAEKHPEWLSAF